MKMLKTIALAALAVAAAACSRGNSDNVMAPESNALEPAEVNAALGPEIVTPEASDVNAVGNSADTNEVAEDATMANATE